MLSKIKQWGPQDRSGGAMRVPFDPGHEAETYSWAESLFMTLRFDIEHPHALPSGEVLLQLRSDALRGLSARDASARLAQCGRNELPSAPPVPPWRRLLAQLESPLVLLLLAAAAISIGVWWCEGAAEVPYDALAILAIVIANAVLGFVQEERAERAVASLRKMTAATALVVRDGERRNVAAAEIVPGDLLVIEEGATIPVDAREAGKTWWRAVDRRAAGRATMNML